MTAKLFHGDNIAILKTFDSGSIDSIVTDPPYGLRFMGAKWDYDVPSVEFWREAFRVLKPGGHLLSFSSARTYHRMVVNVEDAGFEIRDQIMWLYGGGFPKSTDIGKSIDKTSGHDLLWFPDWLKEHREKAGISRDELATRFPSKNGNKTGCVWNWENGIRTPTAQQFNELCKILGHPELSIEEVQRDFVKPRNGVTKSFDVGASEVLGKRLPVTAPASDAAKQWEGWGTALKPAHEPIVLARKPLIGTVAQNVMVYGTGALNIDECRIAVHDDEYARNCSGDRGHADNRTREMDFGMTAGKASQIGRWPANVIHDGSDEVLAAFPEQSSVTGKRSERSKNVVAKGTQWLNDNHKSTEYTVSGSPTRFFYCAKASKADRAGSKHPTVKPVALMAYLVKLVTPPGGTVLDPFAGSGTTGEAAVHAGFNVILIEREEEYIADIRRRLALYLEE